MKIAGAYFRRCGQNVMIVCGNLLVNKSRWSVVDCRQSKSDRARGVERGGREFCKLASHFYERYWKALPTLPNERNTTVNRYSKLEFVDMDLTTNIKSSLILFIILNKFTWFLNLCFSNDLYIQRLFTLVFDKLILKLDMLFFIGKRFKKIFLLMYYFFSTL